MSYQWTEQVKDTVIKDLVNFNFYKYGDSLSFSSNGELGIALVNNKRVFIFSLLTTLTNLTEVVLSTEDLTVSYNDVFMSGNGNYFYLVSYSSSVVLIYSTTDSLKKVWTKLQKLLPIYGNPYGIIYVSAFAVSEDGSTIVVSNQSNPVIFSFNTNEKIYKPYSTSLVNSMPKSSTKLALSKNGIFVFLSGQFFVKYNNSWISSSTIESKYYIRSIPAFNSDGNIFVLLTFDSTLTNPDLICLKYTRATSTSYILSSTFIVEKFYNSNPLIYSAKLSDDGSLLALSYYYDPNYFIAVLNMNNGLFEFVKSVKFQINISFFNGLGTKIIVGTKDTSRSLSELIMFERTNKSIVKKPYSIWPSTNISTITGYNYDQPISFSLDANTAVTLNPTTNEVNVIQVVPFVISKITLATADLTKIFNQIVISGNGLYLFLFKAPVNDNTSKSISVYSTTDPTKKIWTKLTDIILELAPFMSFAVSENGLKLLISKGNNNIKYSIYDFSNNAYKKTTSIDYSRIQKVPTSISMSKTGFSYCIAGQLFKGSWASTPNIDLKFYENSISVFDKSENLFVMCTYDNTISNPDLICMRYLYNTSTRIFDLKSTYTIDIFNTSNYILYSISMTDDGSLLALSYFNDPDYFIILMNPFDGSLKFKKKIPNVPSGVGVEIALNQTGNALVAGVPSIFEKFEFTEKYKSSDSLKFKFKLLYHFALIIFIIIFILFVIKIIKNKLKIK